LNDATRQRTRDDLLAACEDQGVPAGPINDMEDMFNDPQVIARGMKVELDGVPGIRSPFVFSGAELALHRAAPKLGEDDIG
jgi:crotonobetainyl-CoA:carnitine CoA-transferase CaiB-like acyl-CoA transferase